MNIVEAYIKFKGQLIILIAGISGSGISSLAKNIANDFNIDILNYINYFVDENDYIKNEKNIVKLNDDTKIINWSTDEAINWDKLIKDINERKNKGVVVFSQSFPEDKIKNLDIDFYIYIKLGKQNLLVRRQNFIKKHPDLFKEEYKNINNIDDKYIYNYYLESIKNNKITKFINANEYSDKDNVY